MLDNSEGKFDRLRELAENLLRENGSSPDDSGSEITRLLHELRVHQIELNIQNEELQRAHVELATSQQEYADLFDYAPVAYFVIDEEGIINQANLTAVAKFGTTRQALYGTPFVYLVGAAERDRYYKFYLTVIEERRPKELEIWFTTSNDEAFYGRMECVVVDEDDDAVTVRVAITDITERKVYEERLEAIHHLDQLISRRTPLAQVIEVVIDQLWRVIGCDYIAILLFGKADQQTRYFVRDKADEAIQRHGKLTERTGVPISRNDLASWPADHVRIVRNPAFLARDPGGRYPAHLFALISDESELRGLIDLGARWVEDFNHVPTEFIQQLAVQMGIAIQQAEFVEQLQQYTTELETMVDKRTTQLRESEHNEHEQRLFAEGMLEIVKKINQSLDLEHVLEQILINLENIVNYDSAQIIITDTDDDRVIVQRRGNLQVDERAARPTAVDDYPAFVKMARTGEPILIREAAHRSLLADEADGYNVESYLGTPIQSGRRLLGFINLYGTQAGAFDGTDMAHLQAFAEQVSVAVKNARLYKKAQELATLEERQRLARDLHDAVSQLIFSLSIMAESLPGLLRKEKYERAMDLSTTMRTVASSAHAEMQLLLLELRPMRFEHIEIAELLQQLVNAFLGRHAALATSVQADETPPLPIEVKNTLYRIAQEALNNVGKHAEAKNIEIKLWVHNNIIHLSVEDDGQGFDATEAPEGHGLWIMRERAESIAATCSIESQAGAGTRVHVTYKVSG